MMIAEARLRSARLEGTETPTVQPPVRKKRLTVPALVLGMVSVLLLILAGVVIAVARIFTAAASG